MPKFIKIHNKIINIKSISKAEFISDNISLEDFPLNEDGQPELDFIPFIFGKLELLTGEKIDMVIDLFWMEEKQTEDEWYEHNRLIIKVSWDQLVKSLGDITKVTDYEYRLSWYEFRIKEMAIKYKIA